MSDQKNIKFERLSLIEGLSQSVVNCIVQDYMGFMWFGTQDGLNKYDGKKFIVYKNIRENKNSISNNYIYCICEDLKNNLWIGTQKGLCRYDRAKDRFVNYFPVKETKLSTANQIRSIFCDSAGNLWLGTYGFGLGRFMEDNNEFDFYTTSFHDSNGLCNDRVTAICEDNFNNLFIGTWGGGLDVFNLKEKKFTHINYPEDTLQIIDQRRISSLFKIRDGRIIAGTNNGLYFIDYQKSRYESITSQHGRENTLSNNLISQVYEDEENNLWIGTKEGGLNYYDRKKKKFKCYKLENSNPFSLSNNSVISICEDRSGIIWIGTFGGGINKFSKHSKRISHYYNESGNNESLSSNKVYCFYEDTENNLWIGTQDGGLNLLDSGRKKFRRFMNNEEDLNSLSKNNVTSITEDKDGNIWIATSGGGLNKYVKSENKFYRFRSDKNIADSIGHDTIFSLATGKDGNIWIGTVGNGLNKLDTRRGTFTHYFHEENNGNSISSNRVRTIHLDRNGILWIGTDNGGLNKFNPENNQFTCYKNETGNPLSISSNDVCTIFEDKKGILWLGTMNAGLNKFDKEKEIFKRYGEEDGLPNECINGILEDNDNNLWISTNNGLSKFNMGNETFRNYDVRDGLQSNEFNPWASLKLRSGEFVFGGINGFNIFHPEDMIDNSYIPPVVITDFQIFNKPVEISANGSPLKKSITLEKEISLTYSQSVFSFEFAALDYNVPGKNLYAYKMEGFDKEWVFSGNRRFATYTNLDPGEYLFRVKGSNNDQIWNEEGTSMKIKITPPFWKTWWFKMIGAAAIAATAGSVYRNKLNKVTREKKAQEEFTKRLIDVQEKDRKRIAAELHDSIGHDLLITKNKLLMTAKKPDDKDFIKDNINEVTEIITETLKGVREIQYNLHPYQIERLGISKAIQSLIDRVTKSTDIIFTSNIDNIDGLISQDAEIGLYRILQECINNIVKHSKSTEAILNVNKSPGEISILVNDNGKGFDVERLKSDFEKHGFGLRGISERIRLMEGKLNINSAPGKGSEFNIKIPY